MLCIQCSVLHAQYSILSTPYSALTGSIEEGRTAELSYALPQGWHRTLGLSSIPPFSPSTSPCAQGSVHPLEPQGAGGRELRGDTRQVLMCLSFPSSSHILPALHKAS